MMLRNKSRGSLELPKNASSYRGCQILKASTNKATIPAPLVDFSPAQKSSSTWTSKNDDAAPSLNDSMLLSPEKTTGRESDTTGAAMHYLDCPTSVTDSMKSQYITAMKDLRKGFPPICSLVNCAVDVVIGSLWRTKAGSPEAKVQSLLRLQRFWVSTDDLKARYDNSSVESLSVGLLAETTANALSLTAVDNGIAEEIQQPSIQTPQEPGISTEVVVSTNLDSDEEEAKGRAKKEKEQYRAHSKRCRRYHFQILLRLALYRVLCNRKLAEDCRASPFFQAMRNDIVELVQSLATKEKYDYIWRFMESEIEYRCGTERCIQRIMNAVCDELIIPLPDFTDSLPKRPSGSGVRRNLLLRKSTSLDQTSSTDNFIPVPPRRMPSQNGLRLDGKPLLGAPNQTSPFGRHRFQRQRSSIECAPTSLQRSNSSSQLTKSVSQKPENVYESKKRALAPMGNLSQPPQKVMATEENRSSFAAFGSQPPSTPTRMSSPPPPSPRGTPYREAQLRLTGDPNLMPSPGGPSAILTQWSPFHKQPPAERSNAPPGETAGVTRTRRQLQF
ncbi:hypothetical protein RvY_01130 [Ramazzottius varieornatus]|uniref:Uncharacterized protein n=1 Tax=Ramazzottius varieornatus TaxID=947166 RepID=A0A1D1UFL0_RAMVA|nr:hypothetical protein RvY_01130 [Ramazzottius varieornatus]